MTKKFLSYAVGLMLVATCIPQAVAQTTIHRDGLGYTYRSASGQTTRAYRFDSGATYLRTGRVATYSDSSGTSGTIYCGSSGRFDSFSNYRQGWTGSGYTPYRAPLTTTYRRTYFSSGVGWGTAGVAGVGGLGWGIRRLGRTG